MPASTPIEFSFMRQLYYNHAMKLMAIDYGDKRVGIASTDESGHFALPREVWPNDEMLIERVMRFKKENGVEKVIIGDSRNYKGEPNPIMDKIRKFKTDLNDLGVEALLHPEVLTTMEARQIQGQTGMTDASAAALILKNYIETVYNTGNGSSSEEKNIS